MRLVEEDAAKPKHSPRCRPTLHRPVAYASRYGRLRLSGRITPCAEEHSVLHPQRSRGSFGRLPPPRGFLALFAGGAFSGSTDIFGSMLGGGTAERGSGMVGGRCWIPGSIFEGGMAGVPDSDGFSGVIAGPASDSFSGRGAGGTTSAANTPGDASSASQTVIARPTTMTIL